MGRLALFVRYGVEIRVFLNEATRDRVKGAVLLHTVSDSPFLEEYAKEYGVQLVNVIGLSEKQGRIEAWFNSSRMSRNRLRGTANYKHYSSSNNVKRFSDRWKGNLFLYWFLEKLNNIFGENRISEYVISLLKKHNVKEVWFNGCSSVSSKIMAASAFNVGCHTVSYVNSGKDYFINNYIPPFFNELRVWSESMRAQYFSSNSHLKSHQITLAGNPRLDALSLYVPSNSQANIFAKYRIESDAYILYTAVNPRIYEDEPELVSSILDLLIEAFGEKAPEIVVKTNPMDTDVVRWGKLANHPKVRIVHAEWEWNSREDFNLPSMKSEIEWFELISHCSCVMNVASTVTVEALVARRPSVNIGFDHTLRESRVFERYNHASFYRPLLKRQDVILAGSSDELVDAYSRSLEVEVGSNMDEIIILSKSVS